LDSLIGNNFVNGVCTDTLGFVYVTGYQDLDTVNGFNSRIFCMRLTSFGAVDWLKFYSWGSTLQKAQSIFQLANGNFMVGGTTGSNVEGMEIDQFGNRLAPNTIFFTPDRAYYNIGAYIQPLPNNMFLVSSAQQSGHMGYALTDRNGNPIWRSWNKNPGSYALVHSSDASFILARCDSGYVNYRYERLRNDGSLIWSVPAGTPRWEYKYINGVIPSFDGTGLGYGQFEKPGFRSAIFVKLANVGYPAPPLFTPATISETAVSVYPNPAIEKVILTIPLSELEIPITLINTKGQSFTGLAAQTLGGYEVNLSQMPAGLYHVRASVGGKRYAARVVKQ
jgi:hypothetical protein